MSYIDFSLINDTIEYIDLECENINKKYVLSGFTFNLCYKFIKKEIEKPDFNADERRVLKKHFNIYD